MTRLKWDRPADRIRGRDTEDIRGRDDAPTRRRRRRRRAKPRKTMLSDGTVVDGALSAEEVAALERELQGEDGAS